jgi:hypothetical protein
MRNRRTARVAAPTHRAHIKTIQLYGFNGATGGRFPARMASSRGRAVKPLGEGGVNMLVRGEIQSKLGYVAAARPATRSREIAIKHHP